MPKNTQLSEKFHFGPQNILPKVLWIIGMTYDNCEISIYGLLGLRWFSP